MPEKSPRTNETYYPLIQSLLTAVSRRVPILDRAVNQLGHLPLWSYLGQTIAWTCDSYQPRNDLAEVIYHYAAPLLGEHAAQQVQSELRRCPVVLTANHHGVDFFAQSVQGTLLLGLRRVSNLQAAATVPVLACGNVPLNNVTYPRGALVYDVGEAYLSELPQKLPIFPDRCKRQMVSEVVAFDETAVQRARQRGVQMRRTGIITNTVAVALDDILTEDYRAQDVLNQKTYSDQAVILNSRIWRRLFSPSVQTPQLAYLEIEKVVGQLLQVDLEDTHSLASAVLFDSRIRDQLLLDLDGVRGCWRKQALMQRWETRGIGKSGLSPQKCGTFLFWGVAETGYRIPLIPIVDKDEGWLCGVEDNGKNWTVPLAPKPILEALRAGKLLPSLFNCYLVISFARGFTCIGGYYQAEYLPIMQCGVVAALCKRKEFEGAAVRVAEIPTAGYLSGIQAVMCQSENGGLIPAGPLEIVASGGLTSEDLQRILTLTVREAHIASLFETVTDAASDITMSSHWKERLSDECQALLRDRIVIKGLESL